MNNKFLVAVVILLSLSVFAWLVDYGWTNRYGAPTVTAPKEPNVMVAPYKPIDIDLKSGISDELWQDIPKIRIKLFHQITERPWLEGVIPYVEAQAFHNGDDIYFRMIWEDDSADKTLAVDKFADGCAIVSPIDSNAPLLSIMMGFSSPVNMWHWRADNDSRY